MLITVLLLLIVLPPGSDVFECSLIMIVFPSFASSAQPLRPRQYQPPFNEEARAKAGFGPEWYLPLAQ